MMLIDKSQVFFCCNRLNPIKKFPLFKSHVHLQLFLKQRIWQDHLPQLPSDECVQLAQKFDFSGGQIENICRKILIQEVLRPEVVKFETILGFCRADSLLANSGRVLVLEQNRVLP